MYAEQVIKCTGCDEPKGESEFYDYKHERLCKVCMSEVRKIKYAEDPKGNAAKKRTYTKANPDKVKDTKLRQEYGLSLKEYNQKLAEQGGICAICKRPETVLWRGKLIMLAVDHNHTTKQNRGLLCVKCNRAIGLLEENIKFLVNAILYLLKYLKLG